MNNIKVTQTHSSKTYQITIEDDLVITVNNEKGFLYIDHEYDEMTSLKAAQIAGALMAVGTLTATSTHQALNILTVTLETMNDVREKANSTPLVSVDDVLDDRTDAECIRDALKNSFKNTRKDEPYW